MSSKLDLDLIKKRLSNLQRTSNRSNQIWKPDKEKETIVRIVPYKFNRKNPFIELYFHYSLGSRYFLSPTSFGRPDPIVEFADKLRQTGDRDNWSLARRLQPKLRTFAPIVVRGQENEGVKFWGFGKTVYQELLGYMVDEDYGDITDPVTGRDITVKQHQDEGKSFPTTTIRIKPNTSLITEDQALLQKIFDSQVEITEVYEEKSYEELYDIFQNWMKDGNAEKSEEDAPATDAGVDKEADTSDSLSDNKTEEDAVVSDQPSPESSEKVQDIANAFENLFGGQQ